MTWRDLNLDTFYVIAGRSSNVLTSMVGQFRQNMKGPAPKCHWIIWRYWRKSLPKLLRNGTIDRTIGSSLALSCAFRLSDFNKHNNGRDLIYERIDSLHQLAIYHRDIALGLCEVVVELVPGLWDSQNELLRTIRRFFQESGISLVTEDIQGDDWVTW